MKTLRRFPEKKDYINIANNLSDLRTAIAKELNLDKLSIFINVYQNKNNGCIKIFSDDLKQLLGINLVHEMFSTINMTTWGGDAIYVDENEHEIIGFIPMLEYKHISGGGNCMHFMWDYIQFDLTTSTFNFFNRINKNI